MDDNFLSLFSILFEDKIKLLYNLNLCKLNIF